MLTFTDLKMVTEQQWTFILIQNNVSPGLGEEMPEFFRSYAPFLSAAPQSGLVLSQGEDKLQSNS